MQVSKQQQQQVSGAFFHRSHVDAFFFWAILFCFFYIGLLIFTYFVCVNYLSHISFSLPCSPLSLSHKDAHRVKFITHSS